MEGTNTGSFNELTMQNGIVLTPEQQLALIEPVRRTRGLGRSQFRPALRHRLGLGRQTRRSNGASKWRRISAAPATRWSSRGRRRITDKGGLRSQFTHLIDVVPTILEAANIPAPKFVNGIEQMPMHGTSFAYTFDDANAAERHTQQYFEILGNRAMYKDGWIASCRLDRIPWEVDPKTMARFAPGVWDPDKDVWELYNTLEDFSQANDLAQKYPDKLNELKALFWKEAEKYNVLPLLGGFASFFGFLADGGSREDEVHLLLRRRKRRPGNDPSPLRYVVYHRRRGRRSHRRRRRRDRRQRRFHGRLFALRSERKALSYVQLHGRAQRHYYVSGAHTAGSGDAAIRVRCGCTQAGHGRNDASCSSTGRPWQRDGSSIRCRCGSPATPAWISAKITGDPFRVRTNRRFHSAARSRR